MVSQSRDDEGWLDVYDGHQVMRISDLASGGKGMVCVNLKGCNGSGKSTIPITLMQRARTWHYLTMDVTDKKPIGVYLHDEQLAILGTYTTACGGCDALGDTQVVKRILIRLWKKDCHILFEGVIVGDIKSTFYELMKAFSERHPRAISFCFMGTKLSECFRRITKRQIAKGGHPKVINKEMVRSKYRNSVTHLKFYLEQGDVNCTVLQTQGTPVEVTAGFLVKYPAILDTYAMNVNDIPF